MSRSEIIEAWEPTLRPISQARKLSRRFRTVDNPNRYEPHRYKVYAHDLKSFDRHGTEMKKKINTFPNLSTWSSRTGMYDPQLYVSASNNALTKVNDQLRVASSFWEDWYERKQSYELIVKSTKALLNFARNYKSPRYWSHLAKDRRPADLPSAWLAYQFGIKPLVGSIDRGMNLLGSDFPVMNIHGTSGTKILNKRTQLPLTTGFYNNVAYSDLKLLCKIGCRVTGINPNYALSGASGLGEPFSSSWSVLPWGWAVDYFVNVGDLLSNLENNHPGVTVTDWYETRVARVTSNAALDYSQYSELAIQKYGFACSATFFYMERIPLTSKPKFQLEFSFPALGGNQAANLMSALALTLKGKK